MSKSKSRAAKPIKPAASAQTPASTEKTTDPSELNFASDEAGELAFKLNTEGKLSTATLAAIEGTGEDGAITSEDIEAAVKAGAEADPAEDPAPEPEKTPAPTEKKAKGQASADAAEGLSAAITRLLSFGAPIRGALHSKPRVQQSWNEAVEEAQKAQAAYKNR